jgi:hypothetical protein
MLEILQILSANIRATDFKLLSFCGQLFGFLPLSTTDTAKHNLEREVIPNPTNHFHHSSTASLVIKIGNLKKSQPNCLNFSI